MMLRQHMGYLGLVLMGLYASLTSGNTHEARSSEVEFFNGRKVAPLTMRGVFEPGGTEMSFNGTIQEIDSQIRSINPNFAWKEFQPAKRDFVKPSRRRNLSKVLCHVQNLPPASRDGIDNTISWLRSLASELSVDANLCTKFSCVKNTAFWFCNDNNGWIQKNSLTLSDRLSEISGNANCETSGDKNMIQGQAFDTENYNVIVNGDNCP